VADVFLSYSSHDIDAAIVVQRALSAEGLDIFWDQQTPPGEDWDAWIRGKLAESKVAIVLWSKASVKSPNVRHEAILARDAGKFLPVMIEDLAPSDFPMGLYMVQAIKLLDWKAQESKVIKKLTELARERCSTARTAGKEASVRTTSNSKRQTDPRWLIAGMGLALVAIASAWFAISNSYTEARALSAHLEGKWRWGAEYPCASGPTITLVRGNLIVATENSRFVHMIEMDGAVETKTRVLEPTFALGQQWLFSAQATDDSIRVEDLEMGKVATWLRCN
jgi:hypothetical protein